jgi:hypothetical protein
MASVVWVKVVGFSDTERHSINTLLRLSEGACPTYVLWTPDTQAAPNVLLLDADSYEAGLEMVSPRFNSNVKYIAWVTSLMAMHGDLLRDRSIGQA